MALLSTVDAEQVKKLFGTLTKDVNIRLYTQKLNCPGCADTELILAELALLSERLKIEVLNALTEPERKATDSVDLVPAILISDGTHNRTRLYGTPSGYEFTTLLTAVMDAGSESESLEQPTLDFLAGLRSDLHFRVFVTPTCPYCPRAAVLALRMAQKSPRVRADVIEANEFPEISMKYRVQGVPRTVVNERFVAEGAMPEAAVVVALGKALALPADGLEISLMSLAQPTPIDPESP
jgi:glutaredoxin-like protein